MQSLSIHFVARTVSFVALVIIGFLIHKRRHRNTPEFGIAVQMKQWLNIRILVAVYAVSHLISILVVSLFAPLEFVLVLEEYLVEIVFSSELLIILLIWDLAVRRDKEERMNEEMNDEQF